MYGTQAVLPAWTRGQQDRCVAGSWSAPVQVAVTGGSGFIGAHLVAALAARGERVRCLLRPASDRSLLPAQVEPVVAADLSDGAALERLVRDCDAVVHLAGLTRSWTPRELYRVNRGGTAALCAALARVHPEVGQLILVSSQAAAGPSRPGRPRREEDPPAPVTAYGGSKLAAERIRHRHPELPITVIRPPAVYGPGDRDIFAYFRLVRAGVRPELVPSGRLSMVYVGNLVDALLLALERPQRAGQRVYHVADRGAVRMSTVAQWIADAYGRPTWRCRCRRPPSPWPGSRWPLPAGCCTATCCSAATSCARSHSRRGSWPRAAFRPNSAISHASAPVKAYSGPRGGTSTTAG